MTGGRRVAIVGVGYSDAGRRTGLSERHHAAQAARAALADAGLESADIDGLTTWGGNPIDFAHMLGFSPLRWHLDVGISPAFISPAIHAVHAVASGQADTVVAMRVIRQQPSQANLWAGGTGMAFDAQFQHPFGDLMPAQWAGLLTNRYLHESDATEEDFANFAVTQRGYAAKNPEALMWEPLRVEDYLAAPYISKPLRLLDCDYPCDSGAAVIFTTEQRARDLRRKPVFVEATALSATHDMTFELLPDMVRTSPVHCLRELWSNTDLTAADLDCAQLYDGFSVITLQWLEARGSASRGRRVRSSAAAAAASPARCPRTPTAVRATWAAGTARTSASKPPGNCAAASRASARSPTLRSRCGPTRSAPSAGRCCSPARKRQVRRPVLARRGR